MTKRSWILYLIITVLLSVILVFLGLKYTLGYLLGTAVSAIVYMNTVRFVDQTIQARVPTGAMFHFALNFATWAVVLIFCALKPEWCNIMTCALGLFMIRIVLILN